MTERLGIGAAQRLARWPVPCHGNQIGQRVKEQPAAVRLATVKATVTSSAATPTSARPSHLEDVSVFRTPATCQVSHTVSQVAKVVEAPIRLDYYSWYSAFFNSKPNSVLLHARGRHARHEPPGYPGRFNHVGMGAAAGFCV